MATRRTAPWIKDALGQHVEPGYIIAAGMTGPTTMEHLVVEAIYLDKSNGTPYGTVRVPHSDIILKHLGNSFYTKDYTGVVDCPLITIKGRSIYSDKAVRGTKTFSVNSVTRFGAKLNNFIRIAEDMDEFKESLIFL